MTAWYKVWFGSENYLKVYGHRDDSDARKIIDLVLNYVDIPANACVLDAACGAGRHAVYLAGKGFRVFAFDLSKNLLNLARTRTENENTNVYYFRADIRKIALCKKFDLVVNLFTSFGYFESDEENFAFVKSAFDFMNDNSYYVLDYINKSYIINNLVPDSVKDIDGILVRERRSIQNERIEKIIEISKDGRNDNYMESVRLYPFDFVINKFIEIGFKVHNIFGDYNGSAFDEKSSERMILILKK